MQISNPYHVPIVFKSVFFTTTNDTIYGVVCYCISTANYTQGIDYGQYFPYMDYDSEECGPQSKFQQFCSFSIDSDMQRFAPPKQIVYFDISRPNEYIKNARWESGGGNIINGPIWCFANDIEVAHRAYVTIITVCCVTILISLFFIPLFIKSLFYGKWNHLQGKEPSLRMKILAVSMPSLTFLSILLLLIYTIISKCDKDWGKVYYLEFHSTDHITQDVIMMIIFTLTVMNWILYPSFILERIHNLFSKNKFVHQILENSCCCKYFYCYMLILIIMEPILYLLTLSVVIWSSCRSWTICDPGVDRGMFAEKFYIWVGSIYVGIDIILHTSLIFMLFKGFHKMSAKYYRRGVEMDNRGHESIIEMTRYFVLFGTYVIIYTFLNVCTALILVYWPPHAWINPPNHNTTWVENSPGFGYIVIKEVTSIVCAYLSFTWNHVIYERICCFCDTRCKRRMEIFDIKRRKDTIERQKDTIKRQLIQCYGRDVTQESHVNQVKANSATARLTEDLDANIKHDIKDIGQNIELSEFK